MIEELRPFLAQSRQRVKPRLAGFLSWLQAQQIEAGRGIRIHRTNVGTAISLAAQFPSFIGAFYANLNGNTVRVGPGFVNGVMPSNIEDEFPVDLKEKTYVFVEVKLTEEEKFDATAKDTVTIVVDTEKSTGDKLRGRHPVAVVDRGRIWQLSYFSFNHSYRAPRHFFVPA
jgi:hypothetical protein